jgi:molybdopterin/thiamine biosynthesis adenylyltransferase/rhodanese-related sulfurtransferase
MSSAPALPPAALARYSRQIMLAGIGEEGQRKLAAARVLVIGAGGLGSPAALYLAAAGVGMLGIADHDRVELHNLHRQLLHDDASIGHPKVDSAARRLAATNPHTRIVTHPEGVQASNISALFADYDVIVDGTDNFAARYLNNDAAFLARKPLVYGSVYTFDGQVTVFEPSVEGGCYRCLFPEAPAAGSVPGCGEAGVIGALCGVIGSLQAMEAIKLITGAGAPLRGRLLTYHGLDATTHLLTLPRDRGCALCGEHPTIRTPGSGSTAPVCTAKSSMNPAEIPLEMSAREAHALRQSNPDGTLIVDVREPYELAICRLPDAEHIPMRQIPERLDDLPRDRHLLILCHAGARSMRVTEFLRARGLTSVTNIGGGISAWAEEVDPTLARY